MFDENGEKQDIYNRYAHIFLYFTEWRNGAWTGTVRGYVFPVFKSNDLYRLGVNYICARPVT